MRAVRDVTLSDRTLRVMRLLADRTAAARSTPGRTGALAVGEDVGVGERGVVVGDRTGMGTGEPVIRGDDDEKDEARPSRPMGVNEDGVLIALLRPPENGNGITYIKPTESREPSDKM